MRTNAQEAVLPAYITSIGKRTPREAARHWRVVTTRKESQFPYSSSRHDQFDPDDPPTHLPSRYYTL